MFEFVEQAFDQMTLFIQPPVGCTLDRAILLTGNDGMGQFLFQKRNDFIGIVSAIRQNMFTLYVLGLQDLITRYTIIDVACGYFEA
ncbi:hypothetical protein J6TS7_66390 [Paenibacillus dendritiformis]|nr:hypothetical protein J6TS7_66390 [Paenibacillus dendritiformis]